MDPYIDLLLALEEGGRSTSEIAEMAGLPPADAHRALLRMRDAGFLTLRSGDSYDHDHWSMTGFGRRFLTQGFDEVFKRSLAENWGGGSDSAS